MEFDLAMQVQAPLVGTGIMLSNTSLIYPMIGDNLGKLRIILDRRIYLE